MGRFQWLPIHRLLCEGFPWEECLRLCSEENGQEHLWDAQIHSQVHQILPCTQQAKSCCLPVSSDFGLIQHPDKFSLLGVKSGGRVGFDTNPSVVLGGFYRAVGNKWVFHTTAGATGPSNIVLGGTKLPGVSSWSGYSTYGASGCPLFTPSGELAGLNVGVIQNTDTAEKTIRSFRSHGGLL